MRLLFVGLATVAAVAVGLRAEGAVAETATNGFAPGTAHDLRESEWESAALASRRSVLLFKAPWCGHCVRFAPVFEQAAQAAARLEDVRFFAVDATREMALGLQFGVDSYPRVYVVDHQTREVYEYRGSRTKEGLVSYVERTPPPAADRVTSVLGGPLGPWGMLKLRFGRLGQSALQWYLDLAKDQSPTMQVVILVGMFFLVAGVTVASMWAWLSAFDGGGGGGGRPHRD